MQKMRIRLCAIGASCREFERDGNTLTELETSNGQTITSGPLSVAMMVVGAQLGLMNHLNTPEERKQALEIILANPDLFI